MTLPPSIRKLALAIHLTCSVGWIGAVVAYLVLDITVATSDDAAMIRSAWTAMALVVSAAIVPLALASLLTGLLMALGTRWGLLQHWWVVTSFVLTVLALLVLLTEVGIVQRTAAMAATVSTAAELRTLTPTLVHSAGGLAVLLVVQVLNIFKPQGLTPYGWRVLKQQQARR